MPAGLLLSSPIAEKLGVDAWFFISGIAISILAAVVLGIYKYKYRRSVEKVEYTNSKTV